MKKILKYLSFLIIAITFINCGGGGSDSPDPNPQPTNNNPNAPSLISPTNNQLCIDNLVLFEWSTATDPDGDAVRYYLQIATDNQFTENVQNFNNISITSKQLALNKGVAYYWRVKTIDSKNAESSYTSTFQFYTEGEGETNYLPFAPTLVSPNNNEVVQTSTVALTWNASDVDGDDLLFDVYFDTNNPPTTKISENLNNTSLEVNLDASTTYYWKVNVKDNGGVTVGQVWKFKTD